MAYRDDCKHFFVLDRDEEGDMYFCRLACNKLCYEGPITICGDYELTKGRKKYLPQFITEEEFSQCEN